MPNYDESEKQRDDRRAASRTRRNERKFDRALKDDYKSKLADASSSAERRKVKAEYGAAKARGGIYDVSTDTYKQYANNQDDQNSDTKIAGIDKIGSSDIPGGGSSSSDVEPNSSIIICVNGTLYWTDINASDLYAVTESPNYPIVEP